MMRAIQMAVACLAVLAANYCHAGVILSPDSSFNNTMGVWGGNGGASIESRAFDQSGLSSGFVSGVTDLSTYLGTNPTHLSTLSPATFWVSSGSGMGSIDFDLGDTFLIEDFVLWQQNFFPSEQINQFSIATSNVSNFSTSINVGTFNATIPGGTYPSPQPHELFDLLPSTGRYVRLNIASASGNSNFADIGELAFGVSSAATVPEPTSLALLATGAFGFMGHGWRRKRKLAG